MAGGKYNLDRGGGERGGRRSIQNQPNRGRGRYRDAPERGSSGPQPSRTNRPPVQRNQPPPHARGSRPPQLGGRAGGACSASAAPPIQPPPQHGNGGSIQVRGGCSNGLREFCLSISLQWWARLLISFGCSVGE